MTQLADYSYLGRSSIVEDHLAPAWPVVHALGLTPGNDPVTGDIYSGAGSFGRVKDLIWTGRRFGFVEQQQFSSGGAPNVVERIQHGYDRAGNRLWRAELADPARQHDEVYIYDGLHRLKRMPSRHAELDGHRRDQRAVRPVLVP